VVEALTLGLPGRRARGREEDRELFFTEDTAASSGEINLRVLEGTVVVTVVVVVVSGVGLEKRFKVRVQKAGRGEGGAFTWDAGRIEVVSEEGFFNVLVVMVEASADLGRGAEVFVKVKLDGPFVVVEVGCGGGGREALGVLVLEEGEADLFSPLQLCFSSRGAAAPVTTVETRTPLQLEAWSISTAISATSPPHELFLNSLWVLLVICCAVLLRRVSSSQCKALFSEPLSIEPPPLQHNTPSSSSFSWPQGITSSTASITASFPP